MGATNCGCNNASAEGQFELPAQYNEKDLFLEDSIYIETFETNEKGQTKTVEVADEYSLKEYENMSWRIENEMIVYSNGASYEGNLKGSREKQGVFRWPDGANYNGEWKNNNQNGQGVFTNCLGDIYDGFWVNNYRQGYGKYMNWKGETY